MIPKDIEKWVFQDEIRTSYFDPDSIIISPSSSGTSAFASFRPISALRKRKKQGLNVDLGARFTYAYIDTNDETITSSHFIGVEFDGRAELRVLLGKKNSLGIGWASMLYSPEYVSRLDDGDVFLTF